MQQPKLLGLGVGDQVADARAKAGVLQVLSADPAADHAALQPLALWATRYTPAVSPWGEDNGADGFFLDVTGPPISSAARRCCSPIFRAGSSHFGLPARLAVADTAGAAWALSRFHPSATVVLRSGTGS